MTLIYFDKDFVLKDDFPLFGKLFVEEQFDKPSLKVNETAQRFTVKPNVLALIQAKSLRFFLTILPRLLTVSTGMSL